MRFVIKILCLFLFCCINSVECARKMPTVGISVLVRNKGHILPFFFSSLMQQDYPKDRLYIKLYTDSNIDNSSEVVKKWFEEYGKLYHNVFITNNQSSEPLLPGQNLPSIWTQQRYEHVIKLREDALKFAIDHWCDYILMIDADVILTNANTLRSLVSKDKEIVAPMLASDGRYSNFWGGMSKNLYYERVDLYDSILTREQMGCFAVPMVHSAVLVALTHEAANRLAYDPKRIPEYNGPHDDIIAFAMSAKMNDIPMHVCNDEFYGYITTPLEEEEDLKADADKLMNIKLDAIANGSPLPLLPELAKFAPAPASASKYGCDEIFMINLERRKERRHLMELSFAELGMTVKRVEAVDGSTLTPEFLKGIQFMEDYRDPYHDRKMKMGEVGCFLSHYNIWQEIISRELEVSMVLEDDVRFGPFFRNRLESLLHELKTLDWDFVYLGRKRITDRSEEERVSDQLVRPGYSYWTVGYLISLRGARKLVDARPLHNLLPVDEYIPIMFDKHVQEEWKKQFPERGLLAFAADPELLEPTTYLHQEGEEWEKQFPERGLLAFTADPELLEPSTSRHQLMCSSRTIRHTPASDTEDSRTVDSEDSRTIHWDSCTIDSEKNSCCIDLEDLRIVDSEDSRTIHWEASCTIDSEKNSCCVDLEDLRIVDSEDSRTIHWEASCTIDSEKNSRCIDLEDLRTVDLKDSRTIWKTSCTIDSEKNSCCIDLEDLRIVDSEDSLTIHWEASCTIDSEKNSCCIDLEDLRTVDSEDSRIVWKASCTIDSENSCAIYLEDSRTIDTEDSCTTDNFVQLSEPEPNAQFSIKVVFEQT